MSRVDLRYNAVWWIPVDLDAEPEDWVPGVVRARWDEEGLPESKRVLAAVEQAVTTVVEAVLDADPPAFLALLLHPRAADTVAAIATVRIEELDEPITDEETLEELLLPAEMLEVPARVDRVDTRGGQALRVRQRYRVPESPGVETIAESLVYVWSATDDEGAPIQLLFSTSLEDLQHAEEIFGMFHDVAVTVAVVDD